MAGYFDIHPPSGNARFGCNAAGGSLEVSSGYVTTGQWIITTASCMPRDLAHFERDGFAITALPMAVDRTAAGGIRLRNRLGSLDLIRAPDLAQQIIGEWMVSRIDGRPIQADERFALTVTPAFVRTTGVCNDVQGSYLIVGRRMMPNGPPWPRAQRGCKRERMTLEDRVHAAFWDGPDIAMPTPDQLRVTSTRGSIDFERKR